MHEKSTRQLRRWLQKALPDCTIGVPVVGEIDHRGAYTMTTPIRLKFPARPGSEVVRDHVIFLARLNKLHPVLETARAVDAGAKPVTMDHPDVKIRDALNYTLPTDISNATLDGLDYEFMVKIRPSYRQLLEAHNAAADQ